MLEYLRGEPVIAKRIEEEVRKALAPEQETPKGKPTVAPEPSSKE